MGALIPAEVLRSLSRLPISPLERLEHRVRSRAHPILGELPAYWCNYLRTRPAAILRSLGFARYLKDAWALGSVAGVPRRTLTLAARRLTAQRAPSRVP